MLRPNRCQDVDRVPHDRRMGSQVYKRQPIGKHGVALNIAVRGNLVVCIGGEDCQGTVLPMRVICVSRSRGIRIDTLEYPASVVEPGVASPSPVVHKVASSVLLIAIGTPLVAKLYHLLLPG